MYFTPQIYNNKFKKQNLFGKLLQYGVWVDGIIYKIS